MLYEVITHNFVASASGGNIQFKDGSSYGLQPLIEKNSPIRFFVSHALCELDEAGEWFFDPTNNTLYLWPTEEITPDSKIGVWAGPEMVRVENAQNIQFKNMIIQCLGKGKNGDGAINFRSGDNFLVAGVTFRNIGEPLLACNFWDDVTNSKMLSCDFFDNWNNTRLYGGSFTSKGEIKQGNNRIENCHFTQIYSKDYYGKASGISGVGNVFKNNLIHNTNGQPVTYAGLDHTLYLNEVFNVAVEEGDGGAFYTGNDVVSYGNLLKHNFMHHIMSVPQLIGRASFHCDDMDSGDKIEENVFYKGGWKTVKFGRGAGHTVQKNVFVKSYQGIATGQAGEAKYLKCMDYLNSVDGKKPTDGIKENYLGRMLQKVGVDGWETQVNSSNWYNLIEPFWKERYPYFNTVMKKYFDNSTMDAWECRFYNNYFNNSLNKDIETEVSTAPSIKGSVQIADNVFSDLSTLNLQFNGNQPADAPVIPLII